MAFQTPQSSGSKDLQHAVSLLFSPPVKPDGHKATPATPPFGGSKSFASKSFANGEQATPPSRRRSTTPASGGVAKDAPPPPPPSDSLLDSPGGAGPSMAGWGHPAHADGGGIEDMNISPVGLAAPQAAAHPQPSPHQQLQREYALAGRALRDYDETWVTVFGFGQRDVPLVLREFGKCGDIVHFGTFGDGPQVNWMHVNYANRHAAQRALLRSGDQLSASCMVGVKPLDAGRRQALEQQAGGSGSGIRGPALPRLARAKPYQLDAAAAQSAVVPLASRSAWEKVSEFIIGL